MSAKLPSAVQGICDYLLEGRERSNDDKVLSYFRQLYPKLIVRQSDASGADGHLPGHFLLEIKGRYQDWYSGLFQGLAYKNKGLSFSLIVVVAKNFLGVWRVADIPEDIRFQIAADQRAPHKIGPVFARDHRRGMKSLLDKALWQADFDDLFSMDREVLGQKIAEFQNALKSSFKQRQPVTAENFIPLLKQLRPFFDPQAPLKTVSTFYSMIYGWDELATVIIDPQHPKKATFGGIAINDLVPARRLDFKEFVENYYVPQDGEDTDAFFAKYDRALDAVDPKFRVRNGIFFTDLDLSKFVMWLTKQVMPGLGKNFLVIDPACGSGNLVTNWRSPLQLRHKVVSEIQPDLLRAVEQRMKGDAWHEGKFTVIPKVEDGQGLDFLERSAMDYLKILKVHLEEKGLQPNKPIAFLCNPPYRGDDDQTAGSAQFSVHPSIVKQIGNRARGERYCCFLGQMKLICDAALDSGLPENSMLLLFTKAGWLSSKADFKEVRQTILGSFRELGGILVNSQEFFEVKGEFPIAFTLWQYAPRQKSLALDRPIPLLDLTWLTKQQLKAMPWGNEPAVDQECRLLLRSKQARTVFYGLNGPSISQWSDVRRWDLRRSPKVPERSGLPAAYKQAKETSSVLGEKDGRYIGFTEQLVPCRTNRDPGSAPWFELYSRFAAIRRVRCFSGPPDSWGYTSEQFEEVEKLSLWFSIGRTFAGIKPPLWADGLSLWAPRVASKARATARGFAFALVYADNECVQTRFPARNPVAHAIEARCSNPLTPLVASSYWCRMMSPALPSLRGTTAGRLINAVDAMYEAWQKELRGRSEIVAPFEKPYFVDSGTLSLGSGLIQIRDYAKKVDASRLLEAYAVMQARLKETKTEFYEFLVSSDGLNYFDQTDVATETGIIPFGNAFDVPTKMRKVPSRRKAA